MADDIGGVWRTVGGRRIFIKDGDDLETAMRKSGKFKNLKKKKEDEEESNPRDAINYFLKKGEFEKAEQYLKDYGLEDEREEFMEGLNYAVQKDYKSFLSNKMSAEDIEKEGWGLPEWSPNDNRMIESLKERAIKPVKNTNVQFATENYQFAHGKTPSGRGTWAFSTDREGNDMIFAPMGMTYTEAKKWVVQELNKKGKKVTRLYVGS